MSTSVIKVFTKNLKDLDDSESEMVKDLTHLYLSCKDDEETPPYNLDDISRTFMVSRRSLSALQANITRRAD